MIMIVNVIRFRCWIVMMIVCVFGDSWCISELRLIWLLLCIFIVVLNIVIMIMSNSVIGLMKFGVFLNM